MKISLLIESDKPVNEASKEIKEILSKAGYDVAITWPEIDPLIKKISKIRDEVKRIK